MPLPVKQQILRFVGHQQWLRGRDRILRAFSHPDHQKSNPFETEFFGHPYSGNMANFIDWTVFYYGAFAIHELRLLAAIDHRGDLRAGADGRQGSVGQVDVGGHGIV